MCLIQKFKNHSEFEVEILLLRVGLHVPQGDDFAFLHSTHNVCAHGLSLSLKVLESSQNLWNTLLVELVVRMFEFAFHTFGSHLVQSLLRF